MCKIFRGLRLLEGILSCFSTGKSWISCQFSLRLHGMENLQNMPMKRLTTENAILPKQWNNQHPKQSKFLAEYTAYHVEQYVLLFYQDEELR